MTDYDILLRDHVSLTCRSIDRLFLQGYVPQLQSVEYHRDRRDLLDRGEPLLELGGLKELRRRRRSRDKDPEPANPAPSVQAATETRLLRD